MFAAWLSSTKKLFFFSPNVTERGSEIANKTNLITRLAILVFLVATACGTVAGEVIYVDDDASIGEWRREN